MTTDDDLRAMLAAADPARSSPGPDPERMEHVMTQVTDDIDLAPDPGSRPRAARWLAAAASVAAVGAAGAVAWMTLGGTDSSPPPTRTPVVAATYSVAASGASTMCAPASAEILAPATAAFAGTVVELDGTRAVVDVTRWFKGGDGAERVEISTPEADLTALLGAARLEKGGSYLVNVDDKGMVRGCGTAGLDEPALRTLYEQAFAG
ncbi:MAG: hypothetical protein ACRCY8_04390 [Dermatophilaceae bacterium]